MYSSKVPAARGPGPRRHWTAFPDRYKELLSKTRHTLPVKLGPMTWNEARFSQRELQRYFDALGRSGDAEARELALLAKRLRISCPRDGSRNPPLHLVVLTLNPLLR